MNRVPMSYTCTRSGVFFCWTDALYLVMTSSYSPWKTALTLIFATFFLLNAATMVLRASALVAFMECQNVMVVTPWAFVSASAPGTPVLCALPLEPPPPHALAARATAARPATSMPARRDLFMGTPLLVRRQWWRDAGWCVGRNQVGCGRRGLSTGRARDQTSHDEALAENNQGEGRQQ